MFSGYFFHAHQVYQIYFLCKPQRFCISHGITSISPKHYQLTVVLLLFYNHHLQYIWDLKYKSTFLLMSGIRLMLKMTKLEKNSTLPYSTTGWRQSPCNKLHCKYHKQTFKLSTKANSLSTSFIGTLLAYFSQSIPQTVFSIFSSKLNYLLQMTCMKKQCLMFASF